MITDPMPRAKRLQAQFLKSEALSTLNLPGDDSLSSLAKSIEYALDEGNKAAVQAACNSFLGTAGEHFGIETPKIRILAARPLRTYESGITTELFGDYNPATTVIRVWMKTAVQKKVTSYGTLLSTLCHEFCHHLDIVHLGFRDSPHTRGFYERSALLYHHARGTAVRKLCWVPTFGNRWRIDWPRTNGLTKPAKR